MSLMQYKRLVGLLRERHKSKTVTEPQLRRAIMEIFGTDERTITLTIKRADELQLITRAHIYNLTDECVDELI